MLRPPCLCPSEGHKHGVSIQSSINFGDTLLQTTREWKTAETWFLARLLIYQSSNVSQSLDFIYWLVTIFSFDHGLVKTENSMQNWWKDWRHFTFCWISQNFVLALRMGHEKFVWLSWRMFDWKQTSIDVFMVEFRSTLWWELQENNTCMWSWLCKMSQTPLPLLYSTLSIPWLRLLKTFPYLPELSR